MTEEGQRERRMGRRTAPRGSRQVVGSQAHSWLLGPQVDVAVIMSIKTNKFKMYGERRKKETKVSKTLAISVSVATCSSHTHQWVLAWGRRGPFSPEEAGDGWRVSPVLTQAKGSGG